VPCVVGLLDQTNSDLINVYPNPSSGIVNIQIEGASYDKIEVLNVKGNVVYFEESDFSIEKSINLGHLNSGKYILRMKNDSGIVIKNLVIDK
jgi:hypothetical protein